MANETRTMRLPVELTKEEIFARGKELARTKDAHTAASAKLEQAKLAAKSAKEQINSEIKEAEEEMRRLARAIRSGREDRDVEILDKPDFKKGVMNIVRLDTGELVRTRGLTEAERQRSLFKGASPKKLEGEATGTNGKSKA